MPDDQRNMLCFSSIDALHGIKSFRQLIQPVKQQNVGPCRYGIMQVPARPAGLIDKPDAYCTTGPRDKAKAGRFIGRAGVDDQRAYRCGKPHFYHPAETGTPSHIH